MLFKQSLFPTKTPFRSARLLLSLPLFALAACGTPTPKASAPQAGKFVVVQQPTLRPLTQGTASFERVKNRMMPIIQKACHSAHKANAARVCNFQINTIATGPAGPSARMSLVQGKPTITFNHAMLQATQNDDELAMVLAHEASHQILRHVERRALKVLTAAGRGPGKTSTAAQAKLSPEAEKAALTAYVAYSQQYELEADRLASQLILRGGYAPTIALNFLDRLPDRLDMVTLHPKHPARIYEVERISRAFLKEEASGRVLPLKY